MSWRVVLFFLLFLAACSQETSALQGGKERPRIVSLDYCADQYALALADRADILALSPDATASFSYLRTEAKGIHQVRPRTEDILLLQPDVVIRSYGGGPTITGFLERLDIPIIQIGYATSLDDIKTIISTTGEQLNAKEKGEKLIQKMEQRIEALPQHQSQETVLYMTSRGAVAGRNTMLDQLITTSGKTNFLETSGWVSVPLEQLAYTAPDIIATGFFEANEQVSDIWTPSRHPVAKRALTSSVQIDIPGAWTACSGWFLLDAADALAKANAAKEEEQ
jgi:iron complex transport system substrate-binding protein